MSKDEAQKVFDHLRASGLDLMQRQPVDYVTCTACDGEEGRMVDGVWEDCTSCEGEGIKAVRP